MNNYSSAQRFSLNLETLTIVTIYKVYASHISSTSAAANIWQATMHKLTEAHSTGNNTYRAKRTVARRFQAMHIC